MIEPILRAAISERERIKKHIRPTEPLLTEEKMEKAIREFAKARTHTPEFGFQFEVGHAFIREHLDHWMKNNGETEFHPREIKLFNAMRGTVHRSPEGDSQRQTQLQAARRIAGLADDRGQKLYQAFQQECSRIVAMAAKVQRRLEKLPDTEEFRQPHKYGSMFTNPLTTIAMMEDLESYRDILEK